MTDEGGTLPYGGKLGGRIASLVSQATVSTRAQMAPYNKQLVALALEDFFTLTGSELRTTLGPMFDQLAKDPELDPQMRATLRFLGAGKGQFATFLGQTVGGQALSIGVGALFSNLLQPAVGRAIAGNPHLPLSTQDAASAIARRMSGQVDTTFDMLQQGLDRNRIDVLVDLARPRPAPSELVEMQNRGVRGDGSAMLGMLRLGYTQEDAQDLAELRRMELSPQQLADLVTFGVIDEGEATPLAAKSGMSAGDFHKLVLGNGQPPPLEMLFEAYRRKIIDKARLEKGITQGPVRIEWFDMVEALRYQRMSVSDAIEAAVQGHITEQESREITDQQGLDARDWDPLYATAGNPPGVETMVDLRNRGIITDDMLVQGIRESRYKNTWIAPIMQSLETLPAQDTIKHLYATGSITAERAMQLLKSRGYADDIAQALLEDAHADKTATAKDLSASQITNLYEQRAIDEQSALSMMDSIGYDADVAGWLLALADMRRAQTYTTAAIGRVHTSYLAGRTDENGAATAMDALHVPPDQRDDLLALWNIELATPSHALTEAQLRAAAKKGIITWPQYADRLSRSGYSDDDVSILLALYGPSTTTTTGE